LTWLAELNGLLLDVRMLPVEIQMNAARRGLIRTCRLSPMARTPRGRLGVDPFLPGGTSRTLPLWTLIWTPLRGHSGGGSIIWRW
jgi:hypothetical protein